MERAMLTIAPQLAEVAQLVGDPGRANILSSLMDGRALTASELASVAGVTAQTASSHLAKLVKRELLSVEKQGPRRGPIGRNYRKRQLGIQKTVRCTNLTLNSGLRPCAAHPRL
jgi:DNA-binding transcriptional ArsR family regulator